MYSFLMRAGSSYSDLMAGLGYTDMQESEQHCACSGDCTVWWWICDGLGGICGQQRTDLIVIDGNLTAHHYLDMVDIHTIETCSLWSNLFTFVISGPI